MSEDNKALARRSWEIVDNLAAIEEIYPPMSSGMTPIETSRA